jgi:hypothetical protein
MRSRRSTCGRGIPMRSRRVRCASAAATMAARRRSSSSFGSTLDLRSTRYGDHVALADVRRTPRWTDPTPACVSLLVSADSPRCAGDAVGRWLAPSLATSASRSTSSPDWHATAIAPAPRHDARQQASNRAPTRPGPPGRPAAPSPPPATARPTTTPHPAHEASAHAPPRSTRNQPVCRTLLIVEPDGTPPSAATISGGSS